MKLQIIVAVIAYGAFAVDSAKILGVFHFPSTSHYILGSALLKELAKRGHQVTMLSPFRTDTPVENYEELELTGLIEFKDENVAKQTLELAKANMFEKMSKMTAMIDQINERFFNNPTLKELLTSNRTYDVVIFSWFGNEAYLGIAHHFGAYSIAFSTIGSSLMTNYITGNPAPPSYVPNMFASFLDEMSFLERVGNTLSGFSFDLFKYLQLNEEHYREKYFPNAPPSHEMVRNVSLVLLNSHHSLESPRPYVPTMIQIGGFHLGEPKPLKGDLKTFMDNAKEGVIFFSLGSNIRSSDLPEEKLNAIVRCFSKLSLKILWKFENNRTDLPANIKIDKWFPQRDILAHPNTKLFISHGGLLSTFEAVHAGVPIVGIPVFGDQENNIADAVNKGYAVKIAFEALSEDKLTDAVNEILTNPRYRNNIKKRSTLLRDRPVKPMDLAVYWVEYVLRHKGAHHLKTSALKLTWYQYLLLDVIAFIVGIILILLGIIYYATRATIRCLKSFLSKNKEPSKTAPTSKKNKKSKIA